MAEAMSRTMALPWTREAGESLRFGLTLGLLLLVFIPLAWWIPQIHLPAPTREKLEQVPPQLARLIQAPPQPKVIPPKPVVPPKPQEKPKPAPKPKAKPEPTKSMAPPPATPREPEKAPPETDAQARSVAEHSGLLAMQDQLAAMRDMTGDSPPPQTLKTLGANQPAAQNGPKAVVDSAAAMAGSGGVASTVDPREQVALARHQAEKIAVPRDTARRDVAKVRHHLSGKGVRSMGGIRKTFDENKTALFDLYNRALRFNPLLQGKVLLELVIASDGSVTSCKVISSELKDPRLEQEIVSRVELFDFGKQNAPARTVQMPIDFLPP